MENSANLLDGRKPFAFLWGVLRLPVVGVLAYLFRDPLLSAIENTFDIVGITEWVIGFAGIPFTRGLIFLFFIVFLLILWMLTKRIPNTIVAYVVLIAITSVFIFVAFELTDTRKRYALLLILILATNLIPDQILNRFPYSEKFFNLIVIFGVGVAELFFFRRYFDWLRSLVGEGNILRRASTGILNILPGIVLASGFMAVIINFEPLVSIEQLMRMPSNASVLDLDDINWIELDPTGEYLYASGRGLLQIRRYNVANLEEPPLLSNVSSGETQSFAYDPYAGEIYFYNEQNKQIIYLDASTLKLKRSLLLSDISPGDVWITVDHRTDTIIVVSEADERIGTPYIVVDRKTGKILDQRKFDASSILLHPEKSILYLSFSRYETNLIAIDLERQAVLHETQTSPRVDRMAYWGRNNELLLASPVESRVLRFDADSLEPKGMIHSIFGVRVLAIDPIRNLLLCGSLVTGLIAVYDLETNQQLAVYYLGPWLRSIAIDPNRGIAYISSNGALYKLDYVNNH